MATRNIPRIYLNFKFPRINCFHTFNAPGAYLSLRHRFYLLETVSGDEQSTTPASLATYSFIFFSSLRHFVPSAPTTFFLGTIHQTLPLLGFDVGNNAKYNNTTATIRRRRQYRPKPFLLTTYSQPTLESSSTAPLFPYTNAKLRSPFISCLISSSSSLTDNQCR